MTAVKYLEGGTWKILTMPSAVHIGPAEPDANVKQIWVDTDLAPPSTVGYIAPLVTQLPVAPYDGQEVRYLADAAAGVIWSLRYRAASLSAYKWEFVGGGSLYAYETAAAASITVTSAADKNGGPTLAIPLAGDYELTLSAAMYNGSAAYVYCIVTNAANVLISDYLHCANNGGFALTLSGATRVNALAVQTIKTRAWVGGGTGQVTNARIVARPVRVG